VLFGDIAKLLASLDLDTRPFEKGSRRVSGDLSKMEGGFSRISTRATILGTAVGQGIERLAEKGISVLFGAIQSGEEALHVLQNAQAQTTAVIESTGGAAGVTAQQVRDLAESIESLTTADDKAVQNAENLLLTFTGIGKDAFPAATKAVVDLGIAMNGGSAQGVDFSKTAVQIGKALNDPVKGLTALSRVGVSFSKEQVKRIKQLQKEGDLYGAQKVILAELEKEFGKAGEAAGKSGAAGVVRLSDAVEDAQVALAEGLAPALEDIRGEIAKGLSDPGTQQDLRNLGVFLGDAAKSGLAFAKSIPWQQVGDGLKTAAGFAGKLIDTFAHLPPGVQATIIGLVGLNKLAGGGVIRVGVDLFKEGAKGLLGAFFQRGSSPANPMFVAATGGLGGVPGAGVAAGGLGLASKLFLVGEAIGLIAAVNEVRDGISAGLTKQSTDIHTAVSQQINDSKTTSAQLAQSLAGVEQGIEKLSHDPIGNALLGDQLGELQKMRDELSSALVKLDDNAKANFRQGERDDASHANTQKQKLEAVRTKLEDSERQLTAKQQATTNKVGDLQRTTANSADRIVRALYATRPLVTVNVSGSPDDRNNTTVSAGFVGGGGGRRAKG
jgi:hypothetical protein